jgi:ubiquinone/menaquinone biosynthesis C-methylase UbiE
MEKKSSEWFASWFDSPWYPVLYAHRDDTEAQAFIARLVAAMHLPPGSQLLDLACGQGRHSRAFHGHGYNVTGLDLSPASIAAAQAQAQQGMHFEVADMRHLPTQHTYDAVVNLFTSFGYFANAQDNLQVLAGVRRILKPGGYFVLDFLNASHVQRHLVPFEEIVRTDVRFVIRRRIERAAVRKEITVIHPGGTEHFYEQVQLLQPDTLRNWLVRCGLTVTAVWGDYNGAPYREETATRCIFICRG